MADDWQYAFVGFGSNMDKPSAHILDAAHILNEHDKCEVVERSSLYRSAPIGYADQPDFLNAVCEVATFLEPLEFLRLLLEIEDELGRVRTGPANGPRVIDLDLLLYENEVYDSAELILPHPRMHERLFVLEPLLEIAPGIVIPNRGRGVDFLFACIDQQVAKI